MKKILAILGLVSVIGVGSFAYASDSIVENKYDSRGQNSMRQYHMEGVDRALENKEISEEEAKKWDEHYKYMDEFHNEYGYGGCHGGRRGHGMGRGHRYQR